MSNEEYNPASTSTGDASPRTVVEAAWVQRTNALLDTNVDPFLLSSQFSNLKADYIETRYAKPMKRTETTQ